MIPQYVDHSRTNPDSKIEAFICARGGDEWFEYLDSMGVRSAVVDAIAEAPFKWIGVLVDLHVDPGIRGEGIGTALFADTVEALEADGAEIMFLFADMEEENEFDLTSWYVDFDFERIDNDRGSPMMVKASPDLIAKLREINGYDPDIISASSNSL